MKLKAGALYYALIFSVLIAILSGSIILFSFYNRTQINTYLGKQKLISNCNSGIELIKSSDFSYQNTSLDLFGTGKDSVQLIKKHWGLFDVYSASAFSGKSEVNKTALVGAVNSRHKNTALYLSENSKALSISGNTIIRGNAYLSKAGIKRTNIEGKNYIGKELIYGKKFKSEKQLPKLNKEKQQYLKNVISNSLVLKGDVYDVSDLYSLAKISNSFSDKTKIYKSSSRIHLNNIDIHGNIVIYSQQEIIVNSSTQLSNVVLIAPAIILKKDLIASIHLIVRDSVYIEDNVSLEYPSSIALNSNKNGIIHFSENAELVGDIVLNGKNTIKKSSFISLEKGSKIEGNVYCNGIVSLKGEIYGSLFCNKFYLKTPSAIYENYLLDAVIDNSKKNQYYNSGFLFEEKVNKKIVAWY